MNITVIITAYKEHKTVAKAISQILGPNKGLFEDLQLLVVAPDSGTINTAKKELSKHKEFSGTQVIKDLGKGKPAALNLAYSKTKTDIIIFTDGDMYVDDTAIKEILTTFKDPKVGGASGHPVSLDSRISAFGYYSHLFCEAAHKKRSSGGFVPMSGYLYAIRNIKGIFPIPEYLRAEDAYISHKIASMGYKIAYAPDALAYVHFPKSLKDWIAQKTRSLGGNVQIGSDPSGSDPRSVLQDLHMFLFPLYFAKNPKEVLYSILLYPLRLYLWIRIYIQHLTKSYSKGVWKRIESSKK